MWHMERLLSTRVTQSTGLKFIEGSLVINDDDAQQNSRIVLWQATMYRSGIGYSEQSRTKTYETLIKKLLLQQKA